MRPIIFCCNCRPWSESIKTRGTCKFSLVFPSPLVLNSARTSGSTQSPPRPHRKRYGHQQFGQRISPNEIQINNPESPLSSRIRTRTLCNFIKRDPNSRGEGVGGEEKNVFRCLVLLMYTAHGIYDVCHQTLLHQPRSVTQLLRADP